MSMYEDIRRYTILHYSNVKVLDSVAKTRHILELGNIPQKNQKEGIFAIPVSISSKKFYTGKPTYRKNTGIP